MKRTRSLATSHAALVVVSLVIVVLAPSALAQSKYRTLHRFTGGKDGSSPRADLVFDQEGNLYGTTTFGGAANSGTVFKLTPNSDESWTETLLYSFCSPTNCLDGANPSAGLIFDQGGNLYGTTAEGGTAGWGTVFKLTPNLDGSWAESVLYSFCPVTNCGDGVDPQADLVFDETGNLYSTTILAGVYGGGAVFMLTPNPDGSWSESLLYSFCSLSNCSDGADPYGSVISDKAGNLYGTTAGGGRTSCTDGCGVVFKLTHHSGGRWTEKVLHQFAGGKDGSGPGAGLIFDGAGNLFGTTFYGGDKNFGTVFELTLNKDGNWMEKVLYQFTGGKDGGAPDAGLTFDQAGNIYGTTAWGGNLNNCYDGCGVVFKLTPNSNGGWNETVLHRFLNHPGAEPIAGVIFDAAGNLYGTTYGYHSTSGSLFKITP